MENKKETFKNSYEHLKSLVSEKINLEQKKEQHSSEYAKVNKQIESLFASLSENDLKVVTIYCKQDYRDLMNIYKSDISNSVTSHIENKLNINEACTTIIHKHNKLKKDSDYSR